MQAACGGAQRHHWVRTRSPPAGGVRARMQGQGGWPARAAPAAAGLSWRRGNGDQPRPAMPGAGLLWSPCALQVQAVGYQGIGNEWLQWLEEELVREAQQGKAAKGGE